jgi:hypothetical protein
MPAQNIDLSALTAQQQMIFNAFNSDIYVSDQMDVQDTPIYDTIVLAAGAQVTPITTSFFTDVGPQSGKSMGECNMSQPRRLPAPQAFSIFGIGLRWSEDILLADLLNLLNHTCFEFFLGDKAYHRSPLWRVIPGGGIYQQGPTTSILSNGVPTRESMHKLAINLVIENQTEFWGQINGDVITLATASAGGQGLTLQCVLSGLYARGVQ